MAELKPILLVEDNPKDVELGPVADVVGIGGGVVSGSFTEP